MTARGQLAGMSCLWYSAFLQKLESRQSLVAQEGTDLACPSSTEKHVFRTHQVSSSAFVASGGYPCQVFAAKNLDREQ